MVFEYLFIKREFRTKVACKLNLKIIRSHVLREMKAKFTFCLVLLTGLDSVLSDQIKKCPPDQVTFVITQDFVFPQSWYLYQLSPMLTILAEFQHRTHWHLGWYIAGIDKGPSFSGTGWTGPEFRVPCWVRVRKSRFPGSGPCLV